MRQPTSFLVLLGLNALWALEVCFDKNVKAHTVLALCSLLLVVSAFFLDGNQLLICTGCQVYSGFGYFVFHSQSTLPLFLLASMAFLEVMNRNLERAKTQGDSNDAKAKPSENQRPTTTVVNRMFTRAFGNYDQFSSEVMRFVKEVRLSLSRQALQKLQEKEIPFTSFDLERKLASGGFCTVFRGKFLEGTKKQCAVKSFASSDQLDRAAMCGLVKEIVMLTELNHDHIIKIYGYCWLPQVCLVMEYMPKGTLHDMLAYKELVLGWDSPLARLGLQLSDALNYLHTRNPPIVHRDIKARNVLMRDFRTCKLADFGLMVEENSKVPRAGTLRYVAPEVSQGPDTFQQNKACADIWQLGVVLWEMATRAQFSGESAFLCKLPYPIPPTISQLILACLEPNPQQRIVTAKDAMKVLEAPFESHDQTSWLMGNCAPQQQKQFTTVSPHEELSVDSSQAWRTGSRMWDNTQHHVSKESSRNFDESIQPVGNLGMLSRLSLAENFAQTHVYYNNMESIQEEDPLAMNLLNRLQETNESQTSQDDGVKGGGGLLSRLASVEKSESHSRTLSSTGADVQWLNRVGRNEEEEKLTSRAGVHHLQEGNLLNRLASVEKSESHSRTLSSTGVDVQWMSRIGMSEEEEELTSLATLASRLASVEKSESHSRTLSSTGADVQWINRIGMEEEELTSRAGVPHLQEENLLSRLATVEKSESHSRTLSSTGADIQWINRIGMSEEELASTDVVHFVQDENLVNRLASVEKSESHSRTLSSTGADIQWINRIGCDEDGPAATVEDLELSFEKEPLLYTNAATPETSESMSTMEVDEKLPRLEKHTDVLPSEDMPWLPQIVFEQGTTTPEASLCNRLNQAEKETSRSLSSKSFLVASTPSWVTERISPPPSPMVQRLCSSGNGEVKQSVTTPTAKRLLYQILMEPSDL